MLVFHLIIILEIELRGIR